MTSTSACMFPALPTQIPTNYTISGFASPIQDNGSFLVGALNANHTSTAAITYSNATTPTPWPILLAGYLVSLGTTLYGSISSDSTSYSGPILKPPSSFRVLFSTVLAAYQTIRALLALSTVCQALAGTGGRFLSSSAVVALMLSTASTIFDANVVNIFRATATLGTLSGLLTVNILMFVQIFLNQPQYYAKWLLVGGNCPKVIGGLELAGYDCPQPFLVGCGIDALVNADYDNATLQSGYYVGVDPNNAGQKNIVVAGESVLGMLVVSVGGLFSIGGIIALRLWFEASVETMVGFLRRPFSLDRDWEWPEKKIFLSRVAAAIILVFMVIGFPLNYVSQTRNVSLVVQDSVGDVATALVKYGNASFDAGMPLWQNFTGDAVDGHSWTDFFVAHPPSDHYGFLEYWWNLENARAWHWFSLV